MKDKLLKIWEYLRNHFRFVIATLILAVTAYTVYVNPPRIMNSADDYIAKGNIHFEAQNYAEALSYFRQAKYFAPASFEVNAKIAESLVQMPPEENSGYLIRYYMKEALNTAKEISELQRLLIIWRGTPDLNIETKFANTGMYTGAIRDHVNEINQHIRELQKIKANECSSFATCVPIAEKAFRNNDFQTAEKYYLKALNYDETPQAEENFDNGMMKIIILYFIQGEHCKPLTWEEEVRRHADGSIGDEKLKPRLVSYLRKKDPDCMASARSFSNILWRQMEERNADMSSSLAETVKTYQMATRLMFTLRPSTSFRLFSKEVEENNLAVLHESFAYLDQLKTIEGAALVYEKAGNHIKSWRNVDDLEFKKTARAYLAHARRLYLLEENTKKAEQLIGQIQSIQ